MVGAVTPGGGFAVAQLEPEELVDANDVLGVETNDAGFADTNGLAVDDAG